MKAIYKLSSDFGRMGNLEGVFVADTEDMKKLLNSGKEIYFGEVLGKHSEVIDVMSDENITEVTTDENFIKLFEEYGLYSGFNPFDYMDEDFYDGDEENGGDDESPF